MIKISLVELNALDAASFAKVLSGVYEHSPWVITEAERCRPFSTLKELQASCEAAIDRASPEAQVLLIKAHPDLAAKLDQLPHLTEFSQSEQSKAGFAMLPPAEIDELRAELIRYRVRFGHPFILCVSEYSAVDVLPILKTRMQSEPNTEKYNCLSQITRIGWHRLCSIIENPHETSPL